MLDFVIPCNCLVEAAALEDVEDRSEGLSVDHRGVVGESGDDGWLNEVAPLSQPSGSRRRQLGHPVIWPLQRFSCSPLHLPEITTYAVKFSDQLGIYQRQQLYLRVEWSVQGAVI